MRRPGVRSPSAPPIIRYDWSATVSVAGRDASEDACAPVKGFKSWPLIPPCESTFMEKVNYIHQNPVRAKMIERAEDYRWSSARFWRGCPNEDEPLRVDLDKIVWRKGRRP